MRSAGRVGCGVPEPTFLALHRWDGRLLLDEVFSLRFGFVSFGGKGKGKGNTSWCINIMAREEVQVNYQPNLFAFLYACASGTVGAPSTLLVHRQIELLLLVDRMPIGAGSS